MVARPGWVSVDIETPQGWKTVDFDHAPTDADIDDVARSFVSVKNLPPAPDRQPSMQPIGPQIPDSIKQARAQLRQTVKQHGEGSKEATLARQHFTRAVAQSRGIVPAPQGQPTVGGLAAGETPPPEAPMMATGVPGSNPPSFGQAVQAVKTFPAAVDTGIQSNLQSLENAPAYQPVRHVAEAVGKVAHPIGEALQNANAWAITHGAKLIPGIPGLLAQTPQGQEVLSGTAKFAAGNLGPSQVEFAMNLEANPAETYKAAKDSFTFDKKKGIEGNTQVALAWATVAYGLVHGSIKGMPKEMAAHASESFPHAAEVFKDKPEIVKLFNDAGAKLAEETPNAQQVQEPSASTQVRSGEGPQVELQGVRGEPKPQEPTGTSQTKEEVAPTVETRGPSKTETVMPPKPPEPTSETIATPQHTETAGPKEPIIQATEDGTTQAKNAATARDRAAIGLEDLPGPQRKSFQATLDEAKADYSADHADNLAEQTKAKPRPLTDKETGQLVLRLNEIKNAHAEASKALSDAIDKGTYGSVQTLAESVAKLEEKHDTVTRALKASGTESGRSLAARKLAINKDTDLISVLQRAKNSKTKPLTSNERAIFEDLVKEHENLKAHIAETEKAGPTIRPNQRRLTPRTKTSILANNKVFTQERLQKAWSDFKGAPLGAGEAIPRTFKMAYEVAGAYAEAGYRHFGRFMVALRANHPEMASAADIETWKEAHNRAKKDLDTAAGITPKKQAAELQAVTDELTTARETTRKAVGASNAHDKAVAAAEKKIQLAKADEMAKKEARLRVDRRNASKEAFRKQAEEKKAYESGTRKQATEHFQKEAQQQRSDYKQSVTEEKAARQAEKALNDIRQREYAKEEAKLRKQYRKEIEQVFREQASREKTAQKVYDAEYRQRANDAADLDHEREMFHEMNTTGVDPKDIGHIGAVERFVARLMDQGASAEDIMREVKARAPNADPYALGQLVQKGARAYKARFSGGRTVSEQYLERGNVAMMGDDVKKLRAELDAKQRAIDIQVASLKPSNPIAKLFGTVKNLRASTDLSAPGRQGWILGVSNPNKIGPAFADQLRALSSEGKAQAVINEIESRPNFTNGVYDRMGVHIGEGHEEIYSGRTFLEHWTKYNPVHASDRAYTAYLNRIRADSADALARYAGKNASDESLKILGKYIDTASGKSTVLKGGAAQAVNHVFFAAKYAMSRLEYLSALPIWDPRGGFKGTAAARLIVAREYAKFYGAMATVYGLSKLGGAVINMDTNSTSFGKAKWGNTEVDFGAGLLQWSVLLSRLISGKYTSYKGHQTSLDTGKFGQPTTGDVLQRFGRSKIHPVLGVLWNLRDKRDFIGNKYGAKDAAQDLTIPMSLQEMIDGFRQNGVGKEDAVVILNFLGVTTNQRDSVTAKP